MATTDDVFQDARKQRLLEWLLCPPSERAAAGVPASQNEMAKALGVSARTIRDWKSLPAFRAVWDRESKAVFDPEKVQRVVERMYAHALDDESPKQAKAWELFLKAVDGIKPPALDLAAKKAAEMSDDELRAAIAELAQKELAARGGE